MKKLKYTTSAVRWLSVEPQEGILGTSIVDETSTIVVPHGQKVDEYKFNEATFVHNWDIEN